MQKNHSSQTIVLDQNWKIFVFTKPNLQIERNHSPKNTKVMWLGQVNMCGFITLYPCALSHANKAESYSNNLENNFFCKKYKACENTFQITFMNQVRQDSFCHKFNVQ